MLQGRVGGNDFKPVLCRSRDNGKSWSKPEPIFATETEKTSISVSLSSIPGTNTLFLFGPAWPITGPEESFWREDISGMKQNRLVWSRSDDGGHTWSGLHAIPALPPGSVEAPGTLLVTSEGTWLGCYSPYRTWDASESVKINEVVLVRSEDEGKTWQVTRAMEFKDVQTHAAEAWVCEPRPGQIVSTCWHIDDRRGAQDLENCWGSSEDGGRTWKHSGDTGTLGQSTALCTLGDGTFLFIYNQRKHGDPGVCIAHAEMRDGQFVILRQQLAWAARSATMGGSSGSLKEWTDFSFGEPSVCSLPDGSFLLTLWSQQEGQKGILYSRLELRARTPINLRDNL